MIIGNRLKMVEEDTEVRRAMVGNILKMVAEDTEVRCALTVQLGSIQAFQ